MKINAAPKGRVAILSIVGGQNLFAVLWSIAGCLQGGVTGWLSLAGARALMGLTEAAAIPAGMKAVAEWFPDKEKSIAVGSSTSAPRSAR